MNISKL